MGASTQIPTLASLLCTLLLSFFYSLSYNAGLTRSLTTERPKKQRLVYSVAANSGRFFAALLKNTWFAVDHQRETWLFLLLVSYISCRVKLKKCLGESNPLRPQQTSCRDDIRLASANNMTWRLAELCGQKRYATKPVIGR